MIFYFTESNFPLFNSLRRYFDIIVENELKPLETICVPFNKNVPVLVLEEEKEQQTFLQYAAKNKMAKVILIGFNDNCPINLIRLHDLRRQIENVLQPDRSKIKPVFTKDELKIKVSGLFKSHGQESILQLLNYVEYGLKSYKVYEQGLMDWDDYKTQFVDPAIAGWKQFKQRFDQYRPYLLLLNLDREVESILQNIQTFDPIWIEFISSKMDLGLDMSEKLSHALQFLEKTNNTLTQISSKVRIPEIS